MFKTAETTVSAAVAQSGTIDFAYPAGTDSGTFAATRGHKLWSAGLQTMFDYISGFTLSFDTDDITLTYLGSTTIPAGTRVVLQLDEMGSDSREIEVRLGDAKRTSVMTPVLMTLGAPDVADANGISESQSVSLGEEAVLDGAIADLAGGAYAEFDVPRNVVGAWTNSATITITGEDEYGNTVVETTGSAGTSHAGKKAFKKVTSIVPSANITGATFGTGDVLGLPIRLPQKGLVVREMEDGAAPSAGTLLAAVDSAATATTGDVRGTYEPNSACDGAKAFSLLAYVPDPSDTGVDQYSG